MLLAPALAALAGCGSKSHLEASWTFSDLGTAPSALDCSSRGVISVLIRAQGAATDVTTIAPCAQGKASIALEPGDYTITVLGRSPRGDKLFDPRPDDFGEIPPALQEGLSHVAYVGVQKAHAPTAVSVTFRTLPRCANGIDDDQDGATDRNDLDCCSALDDTEGTPRTSPCPTDGGAPPAPDAGASRDGGPADARAADAGPTSG